MVSRGGEESSDRGVNSQYESDRVKKLAEKIYQGFLDGPYMQVFSATEIRRHAVIRVRENGNSNVHEYGIDRKDFRDWKRHAIAGPRRRGLKLRIEVVRVWFVVAIYSDGAPDWHLQKYQHYECARAHKRGRDFHYAKWIMTPESMK